MTGQTLLPGIRDMATAERLAAFKPSLIKALCHDCRTPLAVIANSASIVREDLDDEAAGEAIEFLESITLRAIEIEGLLADFRYLHNLALDASIAPGQAASFSDIVRDLRPHVEQAAAAIDHALTFRFEPAMPTVDIDPTGLLRALTAIIADLARHADEKATLLVEASSEPDGRHIRITIERDHGVSQPADASQIGLAPQDQEAVPEEELRFRPQVAAAIVRRFGGTLHATRGSEHRMLIIVLPTVSEPQATSPFASNPSHESSRDPGKPGMRQTME